MVLCFHWEQLYCCCLSARNKINTLNQFLWGRSISPGLQDEARTTAPRLADTPLSWVHPTRVLLQASISVWGHPSAIIDRNCHDKRPWPKGHLFYFFQPLPATLLAWHPHSAGSVQASPTGRGDLQITTSFLIYTAAKRRSAEVALRRATPRERKSSALGALFAGRGVPPDHRRIAPEAGGQGKPRSGFPTRVFNYHN
jgi:hypothetical protein